MLSRAQTKQLHQFDLHHQNWHAVGFKTLPPSWKPTRDWFSLNQKYFHQDEHEHLVTALNVWVLWKSKSVIPCVYLQSLTGKTQGEHLFSGETAPVKSNRFETLHEHNCTTKERGRKQSIKNGLGNKNAQGHTVRQGKKVQNSKRTTGLSQYLQQGCMEMNDTSAHMSDTDLRLKLPFSWHLGINICLHRAQSHTQRGQWELAISFHRCLMRL